MKKYDFLIVTYNSDKYISRCLNSLVNQTYKDFDVIIVDDGSTDNTKEIIENDFISKYDNIKYFYKENTGVADSRNYAISLVSSEYFTFVDSDDYVSCDLLKEIDKNIDSKIDIVSFNYIIVDSNTQNDTPMHKVTFDTITGKEALLKFTHKDFAICYDVPWGYIYNSEYFKSNNFKYLGGTVHEDTELTPIIILNADKIKSIDFYGYYYVQTSNSITRTYSTIQTRINDLLNHYTNLRNYYRKFQIKFDIKEFEYNQLLVSILRAIICLGTTLNFDEMKYLGKKIREYKIYEFVPITGLFKHIDRFAFRISPVTAIIFYATFWNLYDLNVIQDRCTRNLIYGIRRVTFSKNIDITMHEYLFGGIISRIRRQVLFYTQLIYNMPALNPKNIYLSSVYIEKKSHRILPDLKSLLEIVYKIYTVYLDIDDIKSNIRLIKYILKKSRISNLTIILNNMTIIKNRSILKILSNKKISVIVINKKHELKTKKILEKHRINYSFDDVKDDDMKKLYMFKGTLFNHLSKQEFKFTTEETIKVKREKMLNLIYPKKSD